MSNGTLPLEAAERLANSSAIIFNGGTLATNGFSETKAILQLWANSEIDQGTGNSNLSFSDSTGIGWTHSAVLNISNFVEGVSSIWFGMDASGLTGAQLSKIMLNECSAYIDGSGYLNAVPEVSTYALFGGILSLAFAVMHR